MSVSGWFAVALAVQLAAGLVAVVRRRLVVAAMVTLAATQAVVCAVGLVATLDRSWTLDLSQLLGFATVLGADPLSGLFLTVTGAVSACSCLVAASSRQPLEPIPTALGALLLLGTAVTLTANDLFVLVLAWEVVTFTFYALSSHHGTKPAVSSGLLAFFFGKGSGALLLAGGLLLAAGGGTTFADLGRPVSPAVHATAYVLLLLAFATKIGLVPLHVWMPPAYEQAPGPLRPLMAGVAVNIGFYGMWRTFALLGAPPQWLVVIVLVLASVTALLGIAHAAVQTHLPRVIAWSSVENAGLITVGLGIAMVGARMHDERLVSAGLLAGVLQAVTHAFAKALLFSSSATLEAVAGTREIDRMRGLIWRSPYSGTGFVIGCFTLAALPPTVGFASEWFLLEALMQQFRVGSLVLQLTLAATGAMVALTAGFAGVAFVRLVGFVGLGSRPEQRRAPEDVGNLGRLGLGGLALGCLGLAAICPLEIEWIARGMQPLVPAGVTDRAMRGDWVVQPVYAGFSALSPSWLWIVMPGLAVVAFGLAQAASAGRLTRVRRVEPWLSASGDAQVPVSYTAFGFANPTRKVLANVLLTRARLVQLERSSGGVVGDEARGPAGAHLGYTSDVVEIVERFVYRPLGRPLRGLVGLAKRVQSGRLDAYITYMLCAVLAMLALVVSLT